MASDLDVQLDALCKSCPVVAVLEEQSKRIEGLEVRLAEQAGEIKDLRARLSAYEREDIAPPRQGVVVTRFDRGDTGAWAVVMNSQPGTGTAPGRDASVYISLSISSFSSSASEVC